MKLGALVKIVFEDGNVVEGKLANFNWDGTTSKHPDQRAGVELVECNWYKEEE